MTEIAKELDRLEAIRMEGALERICERLTRIPDLDAVRWIAIGMAVASPTFCKRLFDEVGMRAFGGAEDAANALQVENVECLFRDLGFKLKPGEKASAAVLRILATEDEEAWDKRHDRVAALTLEIATLLNRLSMLAKVKQRPWPKEATEAVMREEEKRGL